MLLDGIRERCLEIIRVLIECGFVQEQAEDIFTLPWTDAHGAGDLVNYVDHSFQWSATSAVMDDWMYEKFVEKYALSADMREWFEQVNPWAELPPYYRRPNYGTRSNRRRKSYKSFIYRLKRAARND